MSSNFFYRLACLFKKKKLISDKHLQTLIQQKIDRLQKILGFSVHNQNYYVKAITHKSFIEIYPNLLKSNQRLEFLGDSILSMIIAHYLFNNFSDEEEGFLTKARASLVNTDMLYEVATEIKLDEVILYNNKYLRNSFLGMRSIMADAFEALVGAIYLDRGLEKTEEFIYKTIIAPSEQDELFLIDTNYKGQLLELTHYKKYPFPKYIVRKEEGPAHQKKFTIEVFINDLSYGFGVGNSKKMAEQNAAKIALEILKQMNP